MRSPGGVLYCHTVGEEGGQPRMDRSGLDAVADQVCLDIPPRLWDVEVDFWRALTGRPLEQGLRPEFAFLGDPDPGGPVRILLQRLGARRIDDFERWTQMRAPSGHVYCLTDRDPGTGRVHQSQGS